MSRRWTLGPGRTLLRDGVPVFHLDRAHLGNGRYVTRPSEADDIAHTIVACLNARETDPSSTETDS